MRPENCWYNEVCNKAPEGCKESCVRYAVMLNLLQLSNIPEYRWSPVALIAGQDLQTFKELQSIKINICNWVENGNNLYLYSKNFGNGKTSWAIKLMLAYFNKVWPTSGFNCKGIFISVPEFFDRDRRNMNSKDDEFDRIRDQLITCDLVIWDDISSVKMTDYGSAIFLNMLDARVLSNRANIFTGNLAKGELEQFLGGRLLSRIWNTSKILEFVDNDKRGTR